MNAVYNMTFSLSDCYCLIYMRKNENVIIRIMSASCCQRSRKYFFFDRIHWYDWWLHIRKVTIWSI